VLVHGTFVDTVSTFGKLWALHGPAVQQLFSHYGGRVYALDHPTLGASPMANALTLVRTLPHGARLHLATHSRGGLVAEVLARLAGQRALSAAEMAHFAGPDYAPQRAELQKLLDEIIDRDVHVERIVRVACPARGTLLASRRFDAYLSVLQWTLQIGGVPALFKQMTVDAGLSYDVSLATFPGSNLDTHYNDAARRALIDKPWDKVAMHGQSNLDFAAPNNPAKISQFTGLLGAMFQAKNAAVDVSLSATWTRADLTIASGTNTCATNPAASPWCGAPITQMGIDVQTGYDVAKANNPTIVSRVNPVGLAWNNAFNAGFADANPYNGIAPGTVNLWASDAYHASAYGYYLHALTVFGQATGLSPTVLGFDTAAQDLGFTSQQAIAMQGFAAAAISAVPEPSQWLMLAMGGGLLAWRVQRRQRALAGRATSP
jgi:hypothetical protein